MHNELLHTDTSAFELLHAENTRGRMSHRNKTLITQVSDNEINDNREFSDVPLSRQDRNSSNNNIADNDDNVGEKKNTNLNNTPVNKIKVWKDLVTSHFSRRNRNLHDQSTDSESNNNITDDNDLNSVHASGNGGNDNHKFDSSNKDSDSASTTNKHNKKHNAVSSTV